MNKIRKLSDNTINRIAAGEVIERPSSVIKELVENSLDAGASKVEVILEGAGKNLIKIIDNGAGISKEDLPVAIRRHTTSKLSEDDIMNITSFGFRGEALPSIGSISRMEIISKTKMSDSAYEVRIEGGEASNIKPASLRDGTKITIKDLFFATPARLKFLRSDRAELASCVDIIKRMAVCNKEVEFILTHNDKNILTLKKSEKAEARIADVIGEEFMRNSMKISADRDNIKISGYASLPTYNKATSEDQYLYINKRPVKDKVLNSALRVAYQDYLAPGRFPIATIFIETNPYFVDVNVHPAKTEVRFRDTNLVRGILISAIKDALFKQSSRVSDTISEKAIESFAPQNFAYASTESANYKPGSSFSLPSHLTNTRQDDTQNHLNEAIFSAPPEIRHRENELRGEQEARQTEAFPMGSAIAQVSDTYIISKNLDSIVITDQHAAHERLTYEKLKRNIAQNSIQTQRLLMPEIVELACERRAAKMADKLEDFKALGLALENFSTKSVVVSEVPLLLADSNIKQLINDLADNLLEMDEEIALTELKEHILETYACHHSIRAGRSLSIMEMNGLLREMEAVNGSGQCNHGRPTHITLKLKDIEKLFGRT